MRRPTGREGSRRYLVSVHNAQRAFPAQPVWFRQLARFVLAKLSTPRARLSIALVDDSTIQSIHQEFLGHDDPTDVITFPLGDPPDLEGEIVISGETAVHEAARRGLSPHHEAGLYLVHGILHLSGYDDHSPRERARMHRRQKALLKAFLEESRALEATAAGARQVRSKRAGIQVHHGRR